MILSNTIYKNSPQFIKQVEQEFELHFPNELRPCLESFSECTNELRPLFENHYDEISLHKDKRIPLAPDYYTYKQKENTDELVFMTVRKEGKIVAYFSGLIVRPLHYNCLTLALDLFYVIPQMRGKRNGNIGQILLNAVKAEAKRRGIRAWTMGRKIHRGKHLNKLLIDNGFEPFEIHYVLWL